MTAGPSRTKQLDSVLCLRADLVMVSDIANSVSHPVGGQRDLFSSQISIGLENPGSVYCNVSGQRALSSAEDPILMDAR